MQLVHAPTSDTPLRPLVEIDNISDVTDEHDSLPLDIRRYPTRVRLEHGVFPGLIISLQSPVVLRIRNHYDAECPFRRIRELGSPQW
jgi:hypothetical protein